MINTPKTQEIRLQLAQDLILYCGKAKEKRQWKKAKVSGNYGLVTSIWHDLTRRTPSTSLRAADLIASRIPPDPVFIFCIKVKVSPAFLLLRGPGAAAGVLGAIWVAFEASWSSLAAS